jgi:hypothetical protein
MSSIEVGEKKLWVEFAIKTTKKVREYHYDDFTRIVEIENRPESIEIWGVYEYGDVATQIFKTISKLFEQDLSREEILEYIQKVYGLNEKDAKELFDYAEWVLFSG